MAEPISLGALLARHQPPPASADLAERIASAALATPQRRNAIWPNVRRRSSWNRRHRRIIVGTVAGVLVAATAVAQQLGVLQLPFQPRIERVVQHQLPKHSPAARPSSPSMERSGRVSPGPVPDAVATVTEPLPPASNHGPVDREIAGSVPTPRPSTITSSPRAGRAALAAARRDSQPIRTMPVIMRDRPDPRIISADGTARTAELPAPDRFPAADRISTTAPTAAEAPIAGTAQIQNRPERPERGALRAQGGDRLRALRELRQQRAALRAQRRR